MTTIRRTTVENELFHWLVLLVTAIAILILLARASGADPMGLTAELPPAVVPDMQLNRPFFPEHPPLSERAAVATAERLRMTFEHQRAGCYPEALAGWDGIEMPHDTIVWKEIGMAAALLQTGDLPQALQRLEAAELRAPHHPVVAYFRGLAWSRQAERLASAGMEGEQRETPAEVRAVLQLMAIADLEEAIERADLIDLNEPLVVLPAGQPDAPKVDDLLVAAGVERFTDDAHARLFQLHRDRGELDQAGHHLPWAIKAKTVGTREVAQLAHASLDQGDGPEAARLMWEAVKLDYPGLERWCGHVQDWMLAQRQGGWLW